MDSCSTSSSIAQIKKLSVLFRPQSSNMFAFHFKFNVCLVFAWQIRNFFLSEGRATWITLVMLTFIEFLYNCLYVSLLLISDLMHSIEVV